jgi:hypothetical protein
VQVDVCAADASAVSVQLQRAQERVMNGLHSGLNARRAH